MSDDIYDQAFQNLANDAGSPAQTDTTSPGGGVADLLHRQFIEGEGPGGKWASYLPNTAIGLVKGVAGFVPKAVNTLSNAFTGKKVFDQNGQVMQAVEPSNFQQKLGSYIGEAVPYLAGGEAALGSKLAATGLLGRIAARGAADAGVGLVQNEGDHPLQALATGALGAAGEAMGPVLKAIKGSDAYKAITNMAPTAENYSKSLLATPTQAKALTRASSLGGDKTVADRLAIDGILPTGDLDSMATKLKSKMADIGKEFDNATWKNRTHPVDDIVNKLEALKDEYRVNGVIPSTEEDSVRSIDKAIADAQNVGRGSTKRIQLFGPNGQAMSNVSNGQMRYADMQNLKNGWNNSVNFSKPPSEQGVARKIGDIYRDIQDQIAPEGASLNQKYSEYKGVIDAAQENKDRLKDSVKSPLNRLLGNNLSKLAATGIGALVGSHFGPAAEVMGGLAGPVIHESITSPTLQMTKNAMDNGLGAHYAAPLARALKSGNNSMVKQIIAAHAKSAMAGSPESLNDQQ